MIAMERGRKIQRIVFALATFGMLGTGTSWAQQSRPAQPAQGRGKQGSAQAQAPAPSQTPSGAYQRDTSELKMVKVPVNPTDPIATVNGEVITRQQLADECVARKGEEILETLVARKLIEQGLHAKKQEITAAEVDQEIDSVAQRVGGVGREAWLRTLAKERGISPIQYARDIIYPALALRKLAAPRVEVTEQDLKDSFESQYGDKLRVRIIMVDKLRTAQEIWEELRQNPGGFEKLAQERSMDNGSRSLGGLVAAPITRHAYPQNVSDAAFSQLVDGDPKDKDPNHKPKDGDFTGPIQVFEATWVIIRRESVIPAQKVDPKSEQIRKGVHEMIYDVKLKEQMNAVFGELTKAAAIDNKLTGQVKLANEEMRPEAQADGDVRLMGNPGNGPQAGANASGRPQPPANGSAQPRVNLPPPAAASPDVINQTEKQMQPPSIKR